MNQIVRALRATYNFFAGDAILLSAVTVGFALTLWLNRLGSLPAAVPAVLFVVAIVGGLVLTLRREVAGRPRQR